MIELLGQVPSRRRPPSNWNVFFDCLKEVKQFDFEILKDLWKAGKEVHRAAAEAAKSEVRLKLASINRARKAAEALTVQALTVKKGVGEKRGRAEGGPCLQDLSNTRRREEVPGFLLGGEAGDFDFLLALPTVPPAATAFFNHFSVLGVEDLPVPGTSVERTSRSQTGSFSNSQLGWHGERDLFLDLKELDGVDGSDESDGSDGRSSTRSPV